LDLRNNKITVGELLDHPGARTVLSRRFPLVMKKPVGGAARTVTLEQLLAFVEPYVSGNTISETMKELKRI